MNDHHLPPDQAAWLPIARKVLEGKFYEADSSTRESIYIGLRGINHPDAKKAAEWISKPRP